MTKETVLHLLERPLRMWKDSNGQFEDSERIKLLSHSKVTKQT